MFVFFPEEPKVGIKTIKQWVYMLLVCVCVYVNVCVKRYLTLVYHSGTVSECKRRTYLEL